MLTQFYFRINDLYVVEMCGPILFNKKSCIEYNYGLPLSVVG